MRTDDVQADRGRTRVSAAAVVAVVTLVALAGGVGLYLLGREDPREANAPSVAWGDRVERRVDAFVDRARPTWATSSCPPARTGRNPPIPTPCSVYSPGAPCMACAPRAVARARRRRQAG